MDKDIATRQLVDVIEALRADISLIMENSNNEAVLFEMQEIEVELKTAITKESGGKGGAKVKFEVLGIGAEANAEGNLNRSNQNTHTIKLKLKPKRRDNQTLSLTDD